MAPTEATTRRDHARRAARQFGGGSFAVRLVVLSLVPILGFAWLGVIRLDSLGSSVAETENVAQSAQLHRNLNAVAQKSHGERLSLSGLALADSMGVPRELIATLSGIDLELMYREVGSDLDLALDELAERVATYEQDPGPELLLRLDAVSAQLAAQRELNEQHQADREEIEAVFDEIDSIAHEAHELSAIEGPDEALVIAAEVRLDAVRDVILSANDYGTAIMYSLVEANAGGAATVETALAVHHTQLDHLEDVLPEDGKEDVGLLRADIDAATTSVRRVVGDLELESNPNAVEVTTAAAPLVGVFDYIGSLGEYSDRFQDEIVVEADAAAAAAHEESRKTQIAMLAIAVLTVALVAFIAITTISPLRRLSRRAEAIGQGELALAPLPIRGPGIIKTLTSTVNEMLALLDRVDREITGLASGTVDTDSSDIPGQVGESLRNSVDHLARVTVQWQRSEQLASAIVEQAADAIWAVDPNGIIRTANAASERLLELDADDQVGRSIYEFLPTLSGETPVRGRPGIRAHVASNNVVDGDLPITVIARDVSERSRFEELLAHQARHDALTDLPNRFAVLERLEELHERNESVAVLFLDIDGFKSVNDTRGHEAGDRVLTEIGRRIRDHVRPYDFVARLGGDEFVVLVRDVRGISEATPFGRRLIQQLEEPIFDDDSMFTLSASVGVAIMDQTVPALETIRRADSAVYVAKRHGRGRVEVFDAALQASIEHDAELELALRHAIRSDELVLYYQPIVDLRSDKMSGVEALVRWDRPGYGLIPPNDFVPVAERSSLIVDMERWVLEEACATLASWRERDQSCAITIAVNISGRHLVDGDLVADLRKALDLTGADPSLLVFELTETQLLEDVDRAIEVLNEIRRFGIAISVDDFGTGYSSMTYLRDLPIDAIKIDRTFLANAVMEGRDEPLVDAMLTIGRNLHLKVVAEGVETERQLAYIADRGCDYAQGYLFARPVPIGEAEEMLFSSPAPILEPVAGA